MGMGDEGVAGCLNLVFEREVWAGQTNLSVINKCGDQDKIIGEVNIHRWEGNN